MSKGPNHRRKNMIRFLTEKIMMVGEKKVLLDALEKIKDKLKRRGEWVFKTKRSLSKAQAVAKSKKGKSSAKSGGNKQKGGAE